MKTAKVAPTRKAQARIIFRRRVCRQTFLKRVSNLGVTEGTARVWWQQFRVHAGMSSSRPQQ